MAIDNANNNSVKARYWVAVGYPENLRPDWQDVIGEVYQLPGEYCIHDKDVDGDQDDRKLHVHIILAFPNTTTYKSALQIFNQLSVDGKTAFPTAKKINNVRFMHNYLIHDTEDSRKKHKHLYEPTERITFNCFDIGAYEQLSLDEKNSMLVELEKRLFGEQYDNYAEFYQDVLLNYPDEYRQVVRGNSGHFSRLCRGIYFQHEKSGKDTSKH